MAEAETKEGLLTTAELAKYGIPPTQPEGPQLAKGQTAETLDGAAVVRRRQVKTMKPSTKDRTEGKLHEVKGKIKEEVGKATNDPNLEVSGKAEKKAGKVQKWIGRAEKAVGE
jgi:uncharacterized protein YjbJ (UPF0337 family)